MFRTLPTDDTGMRTTRRDIGVSARDASEGSPVSLTRFFTRWWRKPAALASRPASSRLDVRPPAPQWGQADSVWNSLLHWLREADTAQPGVAPQALHQARTDFCTALHGLCTPEATDLRQRGAHARSLRELWHLRAELYGVIARHLTQTEAEKRLVAVNRHFPVGIHSTPLRTQRHEHDLPV